MKLNINKDFYSIIKSALVLIFLLLVYCAKVAVNSDKKLFDSQIYIIQNDIEENKYDDVLSGNNSHLSVFELLKTNLSRKDINLLNMYAGLCLSKTGMYDGSLNYLTKVKTSDPLINILVKKLIGDCYTELQKYDEAIKYYIESINIDSNSAKININTIYKLTLVYEEIKQFNEAYTLLKKYIKKYKNESDISILKEEKKKIKLLLQKQI